MKRRTALPDLLLLSGTLFAAFVLVATIQRITGRLDGVASMVFLLGAFLVSLYTEGYFWGVAASLLGVLAVNFAFRSPYLELNFTVPENLFSGVVMLFVSVMTSTLTTRKSSARKHCGPRRKRRPCGPICCGRCPMICARRLPPSMGPAPP